MGGDFVGTFREALDGNPMDHGSIVSLYVDDGCLEHIIQILKPTFTMRPWILGMHDTCECLGRREAGLEGEPQRRFGL